jgi:hypothetical protein
MAIARTGGNHQSAGPAGSALGARDKHWLLRAATGLFLLISAAGHAQPTGAETQGGQASAPGLKTERLFVVLDVEQRGPVEMLSRFESEFRGEALACGTQVQFSRITPLDLDDDQRSSKFRDFKGDAQLILLRGPSTIRPLSASTHNYELRYRHVRSKQTQRIRVISQVLPGPALASQLANRLKEAGVLTDCAAPSASSPGT